MKLIALTIALLLPVVPSDRVPAGTVIPVMLNSRLNSKDKPDESIEGKVMQEVTLPSGIKIREGTRIQGHTVTVNKGKSGSTIVVKFTAIQEQDRSVPVAFRALAIASMANVNDAHRPVGGNSDIDPDTQWVTRQVGGDIVKRGWGQVLSSGGLIGKWVGGSSVLIRLTPNEAAGCSTGPGYDREQSLWVFSSPACGTYGLGKIKIANSGVASHVGEITLTSTRDIDIRSGSGWLLIVEEDSSQ